MKKIVYVDMDGVLADFESGIQRLDEKTKKLFKENYDNVPGIFSLMDPLPEAVPSYQWLTLHFDTYILSTAPWNNPSAWKDKLEWVIKYLEKDAYKRLILTHHKELMMGNFLIDDRKKNGADKFKGELIHFGSKKFPDWDHVIEYLRIRM